MDYYDRIIYDDTYYSAIFSKIYIQSSLPPTITIKSFGLKETTISDKRFIKREIVERQPGWSRKDSMTSIMLTDIEARIQII